MPGLPPPRVRHLRAEAQPEAVHPPGELPGGDTGLGRRGKGEEGKKSNSNSYFINLFLKNSQTKVRVEMLLFCRPSLTVKQIIFLKKRILISYFIPIRVFSC